MTTEERFSNMVSKLVKSGEQIMQTMTPYKCDIMHASLGIVTEAGELADTCKKFIIYNQPYNHTNAIEELGDLEFYMEQLRQAIGVSREDVLNANMNKLAIRYGEKYLYTDSAAKERKDKI